VIRWATSSVPPFSRKFAIRVARNFDIVCELGRILLQELDDGRCHISCEVVGYPSEPMTTQRTAIFNPSGLEPRQISSASARLSLGNSIALPGG
jgi:hypothetical protein